MSKYRSAFPKRHTFLAVIHVETEAQALRNIAIAQGQGADGVFLINHSVPAAQLVRVYHSSRKAFPFFWMGMNILDMDAHSAFVLIPDYDCGLWVDDAGIRASGDTSEAKDFQGFRYSSNWGGLYFGGVAFKYQESILDPADAARRAIPFMDVITTSGEGTGHAPDIEKIEVMKEAVGDHPLAIASGITPENVRSYLPHADCFLVATGVSDSHTELNPGRVRMLTDILNTS